MSIIRIIKKREIVFIQPQYTGVGRSDRIKNGNMIYVDIGKGKS